jgi:hypothetical protein
MGLYQRGAHDREAGFIVRLAFAFTIGTMLLALIFYLFPVVTMGRGIMALALLFASVGVVLVREMFARIANAGSQKQRVLVLGAGVNAQRIADLEQGNRRLGFCVVGYVPLPRSQRLIEDAKLFTDCARKRVPTRKRNCCAQRRWAPMRSAGVSSWSMPTCSKAVFSRHCKNLSARHCRRTVRPAAWH